MTEDQAQRVIFNLQHVDATGLARNQAIHTYLAYGMPLTIDLEGRQETPTVRFFDFDHPEPGAGLNDYVVTTQFRVRRGNERGGAAASEDDEKGREAGPRAVRERHPARRDGGEVALAAGGLEDARR